jgi:hypothetical protein
MHFDFYSRNSNSLWHLFLEGDARMTLEDELKALRAFKAAHEGKAINRAFARLEQLLECVAFNPAISVRGFNILAECLLCLKEEIDELRN